MATERITQAQLDNLVERCNKLARDIYVFKLDSAYGLKTFVRVSPDGGETTLSPQLTPKPLYKWIWTFFMGMQEMNEVQAKFAEKHLSILG